ncbi:DUF6481 family protein [Methylobacterium sp. CM6247]
MSHLKKDPLSDRLQTAETARQETLARFRARPAADDPAVVARQAAREAVSEAREIRTAEREALRLTTEAERAQEACAAQERAVGEIARQAAEKIERQAAEKVEQKLARDTRYAARKAKAKR